VSYGIVLEPTGFLDDGVHQARVHAVDTKGNARTATWNFTTDVTPPSISFVSVTGDQEIYKETMGIFIEASDTTSGVEEAVFQIAGQTDTVTTRTDGQFRGAIDTTKLPDGRRTLNITVRDRAGNIVWETRSFIVDNTAPSITDATIFPDPTNVAPELTVRARDGATSVVAAEYFIGSDPGTGEATPLQVAENIRDITFRLDRDLQASIAFEDVSRIRVRQGSTTRLTVPVTNTGKVPAQVNLSVNAGLQSTASPASLSIDPGETRSFRVSLSAKEQRRIGNYSLRLSALASTTRATTTSTVTVTADRATQQRFEARVANLSSQLEQLQQRRQRWRRQLQDSQLKNITALLRTAEKDMQAVQTALKEENYRRVSRKLPVIEKRLQRARKALETGIQDFKQSRRTRNIILATIALIIIVAVTAAYRMMPPPEGYGEGGFVHRPEGKHPARARGEDIVRNLKERLEELIRRLAAQIETYRGTEEEEEGWTGYDPS
ncbi:MAG: hypothetical protein SVU32_06195, partial [Candidatus Nanohaloarchaea archaeon]|nr:hypothetical protein [Candidatus Nanohaloarchaea archaeon]